MRSLLAVLLLITTCAAISKLKLAFRSGLEAARLHRSALAPRNMRLPATKNLPATTAAIKGDPTFITKMERFREAMYPEGAHLDAQLRRAMAQKNTLMRIEEVNLNWMPIECKVLDIHLDMQRAEIIKDSGNMVYRVPDKKTGRMYAYKLFGKSTHYTAEVIFFMLAGGHPNIAQPICVEQESLARHQRQGGDKRRVRRAGLVMEWVKDGRSSDEVARDPRTSLTQLRRMSIQLLDILKYMHRLGFVHGDLKPDNVLVRPDGQLVLIDFGFAASLPYAHPSRGNRNIRSPELNGLIKGDLHEALDMWAYGCTLAIWYGYPYLSKSGARPAKMYTMLYNGSSYTVGRVPKEFPVELRQVLYLLTALDPEMRRFQHVETYDYLRSLPFFRDEKQQP